MSFDLAKIEGGSWLKPPDGAALARVEGGAMTGPADGVSLAYAENGAWLAPTIGVTVARVEAGLWLYIPAPPAPVHLSGRAFVGGGVRVGL
ncbi:MAG: hypothetical protein JO290_12865 [Sphingomonadaceae bacterium]|nr:hypothetical protein [Sphingomonadaceae bacterium]